MKKAQCLIPLIVLFSAFVCCPAPQDVEKKEEDPVSGQGSKEEHLEKGEFTAELNGFEIFYAVRGNGPVCMVMPVSWGMSHEGLAGMLSGLEGLMTMVYFDPRGVGKSQEIKEERDLSMAAVREDFEALRNHLGLGKVIVLGWSNGGMNAMLFAAENPEAVDRLILLHTLAYFGPEDMELLSRTHPEVVKKFTAFVEEMAGSQMTEDRQDAKMRQFYCEYYMPLLFKDFDAHREHFNKIYESSDLSWKHALYQEQVDGPSFDARGELSKITAQTLVVAGRSDLLSPQRVKNVHLGLKNSTFVILESSGHFGPIEEPELFSKTIQDLLNR